MRENGPQAPQNRPKSTAWVLLSLRSIERDPACFSFQRLSEQRTFPRTRGSAPPKNLRRILLPEMHLPPALRPGADPEEYRVWTGRSSATTDCAPDWSVLIFVPIYFIALFTLRTAASLIVGNIATIGWAAELLFRGHR